MNIHHILAEEVITSENIILLLSDELQLHEYGLSNSEIDYVGRLRQQKNKKEWIAINRLDYWMIVVYTDASRTSSSGLEQARKLGVSVLSHFNSHGVSKAVLYSKNVHTDVTLAFVEGMALSNYQFIKYFKSKEEKLNSFSSLGIVHPDLDTHLINKLNVTIEATFWARDLVNEPLNKLNATDLAENIASRMREAGGKAEVFNKKKIESLKMGGLLAVNLGSVDPPTFTILEWKPEQPVNGQPIVLVGKGVVYDTGGMSLKTSNFMDTMKCDMSGSATVAASIYAAAKLKLPLHLIALVPATDNRVNGNAYVPGDVITMFDGTTVEVLNTDAEGRLILADALSYAKKFDPKLVVNFATLTGAAQRAIGAQGLVAMQVKADADFQVLKNAGDIVYERLVEFPMWDEYKEQLKSEIADLKNIGGPEAGMITAGKFLEHFTDYPFIHLDIAGPAFLSKRDAYKTAGGTGIGVRLLLAFFQQLIEV